MINLIYSFGIEITTVFLSLFSIIFACIFDNKNSCSSSKSNLLCKNSKVKVIFCLFVFVSLIILFGLYVLTSDISYSNFNFFYKTNLTKTVSLYLIILFSVFSVYSIYNKIISFTYYGLTLLSLCGSLLLISANNFLSVYMSIELQSIAIFIIIAQNKTTKSKYGLEGAIKYFVISSLFSCFFIYGCSLVYSNFGTLDFQSLYSKFEKNKNISSQQSKQYQNGNVDVVATNDSKLFVWQNTNNSEDAFSSFNMELTKNSDSVKLINDNNTVYQDGFFNKLIQNEYSKSAIVGVLLIIFAFVGKMSIAPFHFWSPDLYQKTTKSSLLFILSIPKIAILLSFFTILTLFKSVLISSDLSIVFKIYSLLILLSLLVGSFGGLKQTNIKRLLAYSGIINGAFILIPSLGLNTSDLSISLFYLIVYILNTILVLLSLSLLKNKYQQKFKTFQDIALIYKKNPVIAFYILCSVLSMIGIPPFAGFFAKFFVLQYIFNINLLLFGIALISSVVASFYYLSIIKSIYFPSKDVLENIKDLIAINNSCKINRILSFIIHFICMSVVILNIFVAIKPSLFLLSITNLF